VQRIAIDEQAWQHRERTIDGRPEGLEANHVATALLSIHLGNQTNGSRLIIIRPPSVFARNGEI